MLSSKSFYSSINGLVLLQIFSMEPRVLGLIKNKKKIKIKKLVVSFI